MFERASHSTIFVENLNYNAYVPSVHPRVWEAFGKAHILSKCETAEEGNGLTKFKLCEHELFGIELEKVTSRGAFTAYNIVGVHIKRECKLHFTFNIKYTDLNEREHFEKAVL